MFGKAMKDNHGGASAAKFLESPMGKDMMVKMMAMKGGAFSKEFREGFMGAMKDELSHGKKGGAKAASLGLTPGGDGREVSHAKMLSARFGQAGAALGGQDVPMAGISPVAYGNPPQAPVSFQRNTVGMGRTGMMMGAGQLDIAINHGGMLGEKGKGTRKAMMEGGGQLDIAINHGGMEGCGKKKRMPSARNQAVAKLMREKKMTLAEASRHIKEHGM